MPAQAHSEEELLAAVALRQQHASQVAAAAAGNLPRTTLQSRLREAARRGLDGSVPRAAVPEGFAVDRVSGEYDENGKLRKQWVGSRPAPGEIFEPLPGHVVKGESALVDGEGRTLARWVKTREGDMSPEDWVATIKAAFDGYVPALPYIPEPDVDADLATIVPIADSHFGLYAWAPEAGADYDLDVADRINRETFARLIQATAPSGRAVILGLGDLLHADNPSNTTARSGNPLDVDTRHAKVRQTAVMFMIFAVDEAKRRHRHVDVRVLPGNHDEVTAGAIALALWAWFRNDPRVTVDIDPSRFWWWRFGANLLGATHGDMAKMPQLPMIMAAARPEDWGATRHRHILTGHIHHRSAIEVGGVIVESFQSTANKDAWHAGMGFMSGRSMQAITLHMTRGEISRNKVMIG